MLQRLQHYASKGALLAWGLIAIVPFLARFRYVPLPQWFAETHVIWLLLAAWLLLACSGSLAQRLPRVSIWMLVLALAWWAQTLVVPLSFPGLNWATAICFIAMALLGYVTQSLRVRFDSLTLINCLAWSLLIGALLQSLIGLCQVSGLAQMMRGVLFYDSMHPTTNVFGHIGQRNQYAHYLSWGILAAGYLYSTRKLSTAWALPLIGWLALSIGWSSSRTALLYAVVMFSVAGCWHCRIRQAESRRLFLTLGLIGLSIIAVQLLLPYINHLMQLHASASGVERLAADGGGMGTRRWVEWHKAWLVFQAHPMFGIGWSQFGSQSVALQIQPEFAHAAFNSSLFANSHNLILQLLAETGLAGTLLVLIGFLWVLWPYFSRPAQLESVLPLSMMAISLVHSMLEYPLWYLYFLAVFIMALALAPQRENSRRARLPRITLPALSCLPAIMLLVLAVQGWHLYWEMVSLYSPTRNVERDRRKVARLEEIINTQPMYAFHALNTLSNYITVNQTDIPQKLYWINRLAAFRPYSNVMLDKARLEALNGEPQQATQTLRLALASYPTYAKSYLSYLPESEAAYAPLRQIAQDAYNQLPERYKTKD